MHAGIEFYVHGIVGDTELACLGDDLVEYVEAEYLRFKAVAEQLAVIEHFGVKHHDRHGDAGVSQVDTFVEHGYGKVCRPGAL